MDLGSVQGEEPRKRAHSGRATQHARTRTHIHTQTHMRMQCKAYIHGDTGGHAVSQEGKEPGRKMERREAEQKIVAVQIGYKTLHQMQITRSSKQMC